MAVIAGATDIGMAAGACVTGGIGNGAGSFEQLLDITGRAHAGGERALAGGFQALGRILGAQAQDAQGRADALLDVVVAGQQALDVGGGRHADLGGLGADPVRGPVGDRRMGRRHVFVAGLPVISAGRPRMAGNPFASVEEFDQRRGQENIDLLAHQRVMNRVVVIIEGDVVISVDRLLDLPFPYDVGLLGQGTQGGALDRLEQRASAALTGR